MASAAEVAAMDAAQAEVTRVLKAAEERAAILEKKWSFNRTSLEEASIVSIRGIRLRFNEWADSQKGLKRWALDGETDFGRPYTPQEWMDFGKELGELAAEEASLALTNSYFHLYTPPGAILRPVAQAAAEVGVKVETTVRHAAEALAEAADALDPSKPWSLKTKLLLGGLGGLAALGLLAYVANSLAPLATLAKSGSSET